MSGREQEHFVKITIGPGTIVIPSWMGAALIIGMILSTLSAIFVWSSVKELTREIRVLQLHTVEIEALLIREDIADPKNFADWNPRLNDGQRDRRKPNG